MNRYTVERRFKQKDGSYGNYIDFKFVKGLKEAKELCGGRIGRGKKVFGVYADRTIYTGTTDKMTYRVVNCGRWYK